MKRVLPLALGLIMLLLFSTAAAAQEQPKYNFASAQGSKDIRVIPDREGSGSLYFYNIDGNQITHVVLEVSQTPADWQVSVQPSLGENRVDINGKIITVSENLYIEPSQVLSQKLDNPPAGMVCITVPQRGYALAKEAKILVRVPKTEKIGATGEIVISATAQWLGQSGAVAIKQNRDFNFSVEVVSATTGITEKVLGPSGASGTGGTTGRWLPEIIGAAAVVVAAVIILLYLRRRRD